MSGFQAVRGFSVFLVGKTGQRPTKGSALTELFLYEEQLLSASTFLCFLELNDREENENHFPIIYGIGKYRVCIRGLYGLQVGIAGCVRLKVI